MISILTPTADQPHGMRLLVDYLRRQTIWNTHPLQWIVVDDGVEPIESLLPAMVPHDGIYLRRLRPDGISGAQSLADNLLTGLNAVTGDILVLMEHDDWYAPDHLYLLLKQLDEPGALLAGSPRQRYYNVAERVWRIYANKGACLCQTAMRASLIPQFRAIIERCRQSDSYGIDGMFWASVSRRHWNLQPAETVVGIKGLPGRPGLGVGHRPTRIGWTRDPHFQTLRQWVGETDAKPYEALALAQP